MLDREGVLAAGARKSATVHIESGEVRILELTGTGRDAYDHHVAVVAQSNWRNVRAKLCQLSMVDDKDQLLFQDSEVQKVGEIAGSMLDRIFDACKKLNGLDEDIEDIEKKY